MKKTLRQTSLALGTMFLVAMGSASAQNGANTAEHHNSQGVSQIYAKQYQAAIESFKHAISLSPTHVAAYYNLGTAYYHIGQNENALAAIKKAIELDPTYTEAYNQLGVIYSHSGQLEKAVDAFKKATSKKLFVVAHYNLGCTYIGLKKFQEAIKPLEQAAKLDPSNGEVRFNLAYAYSRRKRYREAIAELQKAVRLNPNDIEAQFFLGNLYLLVKDKRSALGQYEELRLLDLQLALKFYQAIHSDRIVVIAEQ